MAELTDYFNTRMAAIGVTTATLQFTAQHLGATVQRTRFKPTPAGDIRIHYYRLDGTPYTYHTKKTDDGNRDWAEPYYRDRLQVPTTTEVTENGITKIKERKYQSPKGSHNCPYFTPQIIEAYANQTTIPLLVLTEGEFKAVAGCNAGLHVVGITGIQGFYDPDASKKLHFDILELCRVCKVEKILLLTDADTLQLTYKPDVDLAKRPISFYSSVKNFREAAMQAITNAPELGLRDAYFGHIAVKHVKTGKGLDDLLLQFAHNAQAVVNSLNALSFNSDFFYIQNITDGLNKISEHFGLTTPLQFYTVYQAYLEENEFKFKKQTYRWIKDEERLHKILHEDIQKFMRIGCDWFKLVMVPNKYGQLDEEIKKWKVGEIQRDYVKNHPTFLEDINKYEAWCNRPAMQSEYKRVIDGCFNLFNPLKEMPKPGTFEKTIMFLKHLFKGEGNVTFAEDGKPVETGSISDSFSIALDYLTLQYRNPMQILPVLCLVSPENNTGKTTFLKWLRDIYGSNATIIDNERFKQSFNSHYISKYIIGIDEGFLDVDKRSEKERLKKLATDDRQYLEFKGADVQEIDFYGKIIIASNDADNLMKIEDGEIRWWVVRVHPFTKEIPSLRDTMRGEIGAWLHFLQTRAMVHENEGRAHFNPEHLKTEQLQIIIDKTRNRVDRVVDEFVNDKLRTYYPFGCTEFKIDLKGLSDTLNKEGWTKYKIDTTDLKNYLQEKRKMQAGKPERTRMPVNVSDQDNVIVYDNTRIARCYTFTYDEWVKAAEKETDKILEEAKQPAPEVLFDKF